MRRLRLTIEYDGRAYCGWQRQKNGPSVQSALENALERLTRQPTRIAGASRTDAGVHARGQTAAFNTTATIPTNRFARAISTRLPRDIVVTSAKEVAADFDPRRHAQEKLYRYTVCASRHRPVLARHFCWHVKTPLQLPRLTAAAAALVGRHDFTSFANQERNTPGADNRRELLACAVQPAGEFIYFDLRGQSFLYNMARNIVGTLIDLGAGRLAKTNIQEILAAKNRAAAGQGAPAAGLCLEWIKYPGD